MTNEKKAFIGTIVMMILIVASLLIRPIGTFLVRLVLGTFVLGVAIFILTIIYNAIYDMMLDMFNFVEEYRRGNKKHI